MKKKEEKNDIEMTTNSTVTVSDHENGHEATSIYINFEYWKNTHLFKSGRRGNVRQKNEIEIEITLNYKIYWWPLGIVDRFSGIYSKFQPFWSIINFRKKMEVFFLYVDVHQEMRKNDEQQKDEEKKIQLNRRYGFEKVFHWWVQTYAWHKDCKQKTPKHSTVTILNNSRIPILRFVTDLSKSKRIDLSIKCNLIKIYCAALIQHSTKTRKKYSTFPLPVILDAIMYVLFTETRLFVFIETVFRFRFIRK